MSTAALLIQQGFLTEGVEGSRICGQGKTKALDAYTCRGRISTSTDFVIGLGFDFMFDLLDSPSSLRNQKQITLHEESLLFEQLKHPLGQKNMCFVFY